MGDRQSGNIFFALFGAIALVGILGAGVMTFMKGPLATSVKLTRQNTAETQMALGAQVAVMAAANTASGGDCDNDGYVEPLEWRDAGAVPKPTGGGLVPMSIGMTKKDPWGTEYGYCAWDYGTFGAVGCGGGTEKRLQGASASGAYPVVALVSAGQDKIFTTTCRSFPAADVNGNGNLLDAIDLPLVSKAAETDDDIIFTYTYDEATGASGGLWSIKSGDPGTAVIGKNIETTGTANLQGGVLLPDSSLITCDATTAGVMARNATGTGIEICDGTGWTSISGGGASDVFNNDNSVACDNTTIGQVRYNTTSQLPEFCNGTQWLPFTINVPGVNLVISPQQQTGMNVDGANNLDTVTCTVSSGMYCGAEYSFIVTNQGTVNSASLVIILTDGTTTLSSATAATVGNTSNFVITSNNCSGVVLTPNGSCTVKIRPKASGNSSYSWSLKVNVNNMPLTIIQGSSTNFGCIPGRTAPGGKYIYCSPGGASYDLVVTPGGCTSTTVNPTCAGGTDTNQSAATNSWGWFSWWDDYNGAQQTVDLMSFAAIPSSGINTPAAAYCYNLIYGGKDDWYLPADFELRDYMYPNRAAVGGFRPSDWYWSSTIHTSSINKVRSFHTSYAISDYEYWNSFYIRCVRREGQALPAARVDITPIPVTFTRSTTTTPGARLTSNTVTVSGVNQNVALSVSGPGNPSLVINGVDSGTNGTATFGTTLAIKADSPGTAGLSNTVLVTIGGSTFQWDVSSIANQALRVFVSSVDYTANLGGIAGANAKCAALADAAGIGGTWEAILGVVGTSAISRFPWNFTSIVNMNPTPQTVATSYGDFWDGSLVAPIQYTENGVYKSTNVWTGTDEYGAPPSADNYYTCSGWTTSTTGEDAYYGLSTSTNGYWAKRSTYEDLCSLSRAIYCIETLPGSPDTSPNTLSFADQNLYSNGATISSNTVTISGVSPVTPLTVTLGGTGVNKGFRINGGSIVTTGTIQSGDTISLVMDFPAVAATNTATLQIGTGPVSTWTVRHLSTTATCKAILDNGGSVGDGTYTIDPDGPGGMAAFTAYCDMTTDGGGWTLMMNYVHRGGTTPARSPKATALPYDISSALGADDSASTAKWGHASSFLLNAIPFSEARFYCVSSRHGRTVHFKTALASAISYMKSGTGTTPFLGIKTSYTALSGHSANLPGSADGYGSSQGDYSITDHPFYANSVNYWHIGVSNSYWLCDDDGSGGYSYNTIHRGWVR